MDRQLLLLGLLRNQEMHGYQINEFIDEQMAFCVDLKRSTAYYILDKFCRDGLVTEETEREGNRPERRVYRITPAGEERFQALLRETLADYTPPTYAIDIGVMFLRQLGEAEAAALLATRREAMLAHRASLLALRDVMPPNHVVLIEHHVLQLDAELTWLDRVFAACSTQPETADRLEGKTGHD
jgi:DNA-binding PadR family transcriptional regulator